MIAGSVHKKNPDDNALGADGREKNATLARMLGFGKRALLPLAQ